MATTQVRTQTANGDKQSAAAIVYAVSTRLAEEQLRLQTIRAPIAGGVELPVVVHPGGRVDVITALLAAPLAPPEVRLQAPDSLVAYLERYGTDATVLFVEDVPQPRLTAILDFHSARGADLPSLYDWCRARVVYEPLLTPEWQTWTGMSGKRLDQVPFAQFLEAHLPDIAVPAGATILEVVRTLEVKKAVSFLSSVRLDNGEVQLRYEEDVQGTAQKGQVTIPSTITLGLAPFKGAARYQVSGFFRYRLEGSAVKLGIDLDRPHKVLEAAVAETLTDVLTQLDGIPVFHGPAPQVASAAPIALRA